MRAVCPRVTRTAFTTKNSRYSYHFSTIPTFYYDKGVAVPQVRNLYERCLIYSQVYSISLQAAAKKCSRMVNASARRTRLAKLSLIGFLVEYANLWHLLALNQAAHRHQLRTLDLIALGVWYAWPVVTERSRCINLCFPGEKIQCKQHLTLIY